MSIVLRYLNNGSRLRNQSRCERPRLKFNQRLLFTERSTQPPTGYLASPTANCTSVPFFLLGILKVYWRIKCRIRGFRNSFSTMCSPAQDLEYKPKGRRLLFCNRCYLLMLTTTFTSHGTYTSGAKPTFTLLEWHGRHVDSASRDYPEVLKLMALKHYSDNDKNSGDSVKSSIVPCLGVHPWVLPELTKDDWKTTDCRQHRLLGGFKNWKTCWCSTRIYPVERDRAGRLSF